ncbi:hypothetical protein TPY_2919 [Sulfobacillus acidophilus TPY]|jgi:hypothetical protein|uniref:DUF3096 domain-containing protein n=1 Tax=Sulfobacillus acidophilus (strain ATCC 700253 / DSM 10332 / NAL) TaxID=679936 RepID=G8TSU4_SULAD|nr:hypothetical protein TPY_2919 [Sulfobacillus acidophilus TPY]AEW04471.1 hypothetical protein Sulac_0969 [Sulfobacillus acidophilus DSM 10332]
MRQDLMALAAMATGIVTLWNPRYFRLVLGLYLLLVGVFGLGHG